LLTSRLIVGLGNPGKDYEYTRHNLGFLVARHLAKRYKLEFVKDPALGGSMAHGQIEKQNFFLLLPLTYVNNSGRVVKKVVKTKHIALEDLLVVCDDLNLSFGQLRLRESGSDGGHNGLSSIIEGLATNKFARLRLGIGQPKRKEETVDFVLSEFDKEEKNGLEDFVEEAAGCCMAWLTKGTAKAMGQFNKSK